MTAQSGTRTTRVNVVADDETPSGAKSKKPRHDNTSPDTKSTQPSASSAPRGPIPTMGWPAFWWKVISTVNRAANPPKLNKKEAEMLRLRAEADERVRIRTESIQRLREYSDKVPSLTVVFIGVKGAAGTTTTTAYSCSVLGDITRSNVIPTDLNPAQGTLAPRLGKDYGQTTTLRELLHDLDSFENFKHFIRNIRPTRYSVRPISANDIVGVNEHLNREDALRILRTININTEYHYVDTANDITDEVTLAAVESADVLVFTGFVHIHDSLRQISVGMETLRRHGFTEKVNNSVVLISGLAAGERIEDYRKYIDRVNIRDEVIAHYDFFGPLLGVPYDPVIRLDTEVDLEALAWETYQAYLELDLAIFEQAPVLNSVQPASTPSLEKLESNHDTGNQPDSPPYQ